VFENRVLRGIFGPKRDEVIRGWRKLHNEELHNLYCSPSIIKVISVGFEVLTEVVLKSIIFWDIMPCSPLRVNDVSEEHIASIFRVEKKPSDFTLVFCSAHFSTLKMEAICSSETSVISQKMLLF
jgi:hypothetical protein